MSSFCWQCLGITDFHVPCPKYKWYTVEQITGFWLASITFTSAVLWDLWNYYTILSWGLYLALCLAILPKLGLCCKQQQQTSQGCQSLSENQLLHCKKNCTACRRALGLGKHTDPEFEPVGAVFANLCCCSGATGYRSLLGWAAKSGFCLLLQSMKFMTLSACGSWQLGSLILSGHHHTEAVMAPLAKVGLDRHVPTKCLNNIFLNNQLWSGAKSRDVFKLAIFHLV